jgi:hypothetical protein
MKKFNLEQTEKIGSPFQTSRGYFDALPQQIQQKIQAEKQQSAWTFHFKPKYALVLACLAIVLIFGVQFLVQNDKINEASLSEISEQHIRQYLLQGDIHENDLVKFYIQNTDNQEYDIEASVEEEILDEDFDLDEMEELL